MSILQSTNTLLPALRTVERVVTRAQSVGSALPVVRAVYTAGTCNATGAPHIARLTATHEWELAGCIAGVTGECVGGITRALLVTRCSGITSLATAFTVDGATRAVIIAG